MLTVPASRNPGVCTRSCRRLAKEAEGTRSDSAAGLPALTDVGPGELRAAVVVDPQVSQEPRLWRGGTEGGGLPGARGAVSKKLAVRSKSCWAHGSTLGHYCTANSCNKDPRDGEVWVEKFEDLTLSGGNIPIKPEKCSGPQF